MEVNVIVIVCEQFKQPQVLAVEPSARVNQISFNSPDPSRKLTAVTFYEILTEKMMPVREPNMCTISG